MQHTKQYTNKPEIYRYHDYRIFLKDWLVYLKTSQPGFSMRKLAQQAGIATGYLPMMITGSRKISHKAFSKVAPFLKLSKSERSFLDLLITLGTSDSQHARLESLNRMKQFKEYKKLNPRETEVYQYLSHWYYVAIREMTALPGFQADPQWIQSQLNYKISLKDAKEALAFLIQNKYIKIGLNESVQPPEKNLDCIGGVYRIALTQFHQEMFSLASQSIEATPSDQRNILGHTFALDAKNFEKASTLIENTLKQLQELSKDSQGDTVYHAQLAVFPLTSSSPTSSKVKENKK